MPHYHFNTLDVAKRLESAGFSWEQASEIVRVIADSQIVTIDDKQPALTPERIAIQLDFLKKGLALVAGGLIFLFALLILLADRL